MAERSTKRQQALLEFVDAFIKTHGYGPSYREIMNGLGYKSVSTVAVHIDGLITKGYLQKRDNSARSLEVVSANYGSFGAAGGVGTGGAGVNFTPASKIGGSSKEKWLVSAVEERFVRYKSGAQQQVLDELYVLVGALKVLGFHGAYEAMRARLAEIVKR